MQQQATQPSTYNEILETESEIVTAESKRGDETIYLPKVVSKGTEYGVYFRTAPLSVLYSQLGQDGDACSDQLEDHLEVRKLNPSQQKKDFFYLGLGITQPLFGVVFCL